VRPRHVGGCADRVAPCSVHALVQLACTAIRRASDRDPAYGGARACHNLLPLLVLLLRRLEIPVLVHGTLESSGGVASAYILRELGVLPCATLAQAEQALQQNLLAFVPLALLSPGLASLLALRTRLGIGTPAHLAVKLVEPFGGRGVMLVGAGTEARLAQLANVLTVSAQSALLLHSCEGGTVRGPTATAADRLVSNRVAATRCSRWRPVR
jgi:anthranilate phosphoribosyltransferase